MYIKILFDNARLKGVLKLILIVSVVHVASFYWNQRVPLGLLYGPLLLLIVREMERVTLWMHTLPFFLFSGLYLVFKVDAVAFGDWQLYHTIYLFALAVSLCSYAVAVTVVCKKEHLVTVFEKEFLQVLAYGCYFAALLVVLLALRVGFGILDFGFDPVSMLFFQLGIFSVLILIFLVFYGKKEKGRRILKKNPVVLPGIDVATSLMYRETLEKCIRETNIYRNPDISLEMLSIETTIPKHHLSQLLNGCFGKNFYQYIAELRIEYAISCLKKDSGIKIESLAYDCGFNSKTSFNRYFKEYTGYLPSYYKIKVQHL
ncbi:AraC family transcriptional regulator [Flavobacterium supellecticarium]|uniref:AraC family transcriptional regulator n=1 Tax=Flavobacterium supellecticarium TaxID=2565924 RepID=A0A4S3ZPH7_9FLAO|nr:helix-turn-helix domain-containing protein [Flavobacterium supellecticarium]THF47409.1 AraC family transcriptional regulator [Flavobacterium supellecticarium]